MPRVLESPTLPDTAATNATPAPGAPGAPGAPDPSDMSDMSDMSEPPLRPGTRVEVRKRLDGDWARGFEVVDGGPDGYRLRRLSDGGELPLTFSDDDVRKEKKRGTWWY